MQLKLLTWNIWQGNHLEKILSFLKTSNADIIGLQEVIEKDDTNTAAIIAKALGYHFAYYRSVDKNALGVPQGNAILSKLPIQESKRHFLSDKSFYEKTPETEPRIAVEATIQVNDASLNIFTVHLAYSHKFQNSAMRNLQVAHLIKLLPASQTILMGDFNSYPDSPYMTKLDQVMSNADKHVTSPTWTMYPFEYQGFKENELKHRLDYIFTTKDVRIKQFTVESSDGSDHLPLTAIIEI